MNRKLLLVFMLISASWSMGWAEEEGRAVATIEGDRQVSFGKDILPILRKNCLACHSESETEGELVMETVESVLKGGDSGPAIVPGKAEESLVFQLATHRTEPFMPPLDNDVGAKPLTAQSLGLLKLWIDQGAKADATPVVEEISWQPVPESLAPIFALDVSADGRWLAAGRGNQLVLYSVVGKREVQRLMDPSIEATHPGCAHLDIVQSVAFSPDQRTLVSGGYKCIKVWQRSPRAVDWETAAGKDQLPPDTDFGELVDVQVSADQQRLIVVAKSGDNVSAKLLALPSQKLIKEVSVEVFAQEHLADLERNVGLRKERLRVANADVEVAKKRKTDDENNAKKGVEELKKAEEEVPKRKEAFAKAAEAAKQKSDEVNSVTETLEAEKAKLAKFDEELAAASEEAKAEIAEAKTKTEADVKQRETELDNKKKELEKAQAEEKKKRQEFEGAEKVVVLAKEAIARAEKAVERRTSELADAEKEAAGFDEKMKEAEKSLADGRQQAAADKPEFTRAAFLDDGWELAVWDNHGKVARLLGETGDLISVESVEGDAVLGDWTLVKTIGYPASHDVFADRVTALAFNENGSVLATGGGEPSRSGEVKLWNTKDWSVISEIPDAHSDVVYDLQFSPQNDTLASCASDRMMKLIDTQAAKPLRSFEGHTGHVLGVDWRADGRTLVTAGADKVVKVWDAKEGTQTKTISGFKKEITSVRYLGLEDRFVFSAGNGEVESRKSDGGGQPGFSGFSDYVHRVSGSEDGKVVAAAGQDKVIRVWDPQGKLIVEFK